MGSIDPPTSHHLYPPFSDQVATAPLVSISLTQLEAGSEAESVAFYKASKDLGFFYLQLGGSKVGERLVEEAERLNDVAREFYRRPVEEREEFSREKIDDFFGYRQTKLKDSYPDGRPKLNEIYNMRKDDFVGNTDPLPCHELVKQNWELLTSYVRDCRQVIDLLITHLEKHLHLRPGALAELHRITERSGDHVRFIQAAPIEFSEERAAIGEHTDFGTLTFLMNWLGGLQIRRPDNNEWVFVRPIPGSAVVNLGDALVKFTAGILRSNVHRVVPPPAPQGGLERNSLVYFSRPEDEIVLKRLTGGIIDEQPVADDEGPEMTAREWTWKRSVGNLQGIYTHKGGLEAREGYWPSRV